MFQSYAKERIQGFFSEVVPFLASKYGTEAVWVPNLQCLIQDAYKSTIRLKEAGLSEIVAVYDPWANPLYRASIRMEHIYNKFEKSCSGTARWAEDEVLNLGGIGLHAPFTCFSKPGSSWGVPKDMISEFTPEDTRPDTWHGEEDEEEEKDEEEEEGEEDEEGKEKETAVQVDRSGDDGDDRDGDDKEEDGGEEEGNKKETALQIDDSDEEIQSLEEEEDEQEVEGNMKETASHIEDNNEDIQDCEEEG